VADYRTQYEWGMNMSTISRAATVRRADHYKPEGARSGRAAPLQAHYEEEDREIDESKRMLERGVAARRREADISLWRNEEGAQSEETPAAAGRTFRSGNDRKSSFQRSQWSQAAIAILRERWSKGHSASQIATAIERETGQRCSRNAVIGKLHRIGLTGRTTPVRSARLIRNRITNALARLAPTLGTPRASMRARAPRPVVKALALAPILNAECEFITVLNVRDGECRFIAGDPHCDARFCGRATRARGHGSYEPFCPAHALACYAPEPTGSANRQ
jgi:GcrA cell cycle regulator